MKRKDPEPHFCATGCDTPRRPAYGSPYSVSKTARARAAKHVMTMIHALEEHLAEAEREGNKLMAGIYDTLLDGLYNAELPSKAGVVTVNLKPNARMEVRR
ncbi:MAG TPA: hypothetical protein VMT05_03365 [Terriglobales bacterium]|nr:hypothetical protein [Terriglobales bacterium]